MCVLLLLVVALRVSCLWMLSLLAITIMVATCVHGCSSWWLLVCVCVWRVCLARYDGFALIEQRDFFLAAVPLQDRLLEAGLYCRNDVAHIRIASLHH